MPDHFPSTLDRSHDHRSLPLIDRMDSAIGETSTVMGAMISEFLRRTLRGGVLQIDEELHAFVVEHVGATLASRIPAIEEAASEVAESTARRAATEITKEKIHNLEERTREEDRKLAAHLDEATRALSVRIESAAEKAEQATSHTAQEMAHRLEEATKRALQNHQETAQALSGKIEEFDKNVRQASEESARALSGKIEEVHAHAQRITHESSLAISGKIDEVHKNVRQATHESAQTLTGKIDEVHKTAQQATHQVEQHLSTKIDDAEKRAQETAHAEINRQMDDFVQRNRKGTALLKEHLQALDATIQGLKQQLLDEQATRAQELSESAANFQLRLDALTQRQQQVDLENQDRVGALAREFVKRVDERESRLRAELIEANQLLADRVAELEKPRGLRALFQRFFGGKKQ